MNRSNWRQLRDLLDAKVLRHSDPLAYTLLQGELADRGVVPNEAKWLTEAYKHGIQGALENGTISDGVFTRTTGRMFNAGHRRDVAQYAVEMWRRAIYRNKSVAPAKSGTPTGQNWLHQFGNPGTQNAPSRSRFWALVLVLMLAVASVWYTQSRFDYSIPNGTDVAQHRALKEPLQLELPLSNPQATTIHEDSPRAGSKSRSTNNLPAHDASLGANESSAPAREHDVPVSQQPETPSSAPTPVLNLPSPPLHLALLTLDAARLLENIFLRGRSSNPPREAQPSATTVSAKLKPTAGVYLQEDKTARKLFRQAKLASKHGNHQQAIAGFTELIESGVVDTWVYHNRASSRVFLHDYEEARADLDSAIELDSSNHLAFALRALLKTVVDGDEVAGALDIQQAVSLDSNAAYNYYVRAICRRHSRTQEKLELAVLDCDKAIALCHKTKHPTWLLRDTHFVKGLATKDLGMRSQAHAQFRQALVIDPSHARAQRGFQATRP